MYSVGKLPFAYSKYSSDTSYVILYTTSSTVISKLYSNPLAVLTVIVAVPWLSALNLFVEFTEMISGFEDVISYYSFADSGLNLTDTL